MTGQHCYSSLFSTGKMTGAFPRSLDGGHSRERLGRFPIDDGNAIEYLLRYTKEGEGSDLHRLLEKLCRGLNEDSFGHSGFNEGSAGIEMLGWLDVEDISKIRREIEKGAGQSGPMSPSTEECRMHSGIFLYFSERLSKGNAGF